MGFKACEICDEFVDAAKRGDHLLRRHVEVTTDKFNPDPKKLESVDRGWWVWGVAQKLGLEPRMVYVHEAVLFYTDRWVVEATRELKKMGVPFERLEACFVGGRETEWRARGEAELAARALEQLVTQEANRG